ncbi:FAD-dependent monooxygenase [Georgenia sp. Z1491]|uniref:FAD-dependent monooxygenase n=1 Tax=Georgenia sp. Z1491 TaxID=3416707 RepID=UPI003CEB1C42
MAAITTVGIVGAGAAGTTLAAYLARGGIDVEVLERTPEPSTLGSGLTLQGNALRLLKDLGVWEQLESHGYGFSELGIRAPDPDGTVLTVMDDMRTGGPDLPSTLGIYRPDLARIVRERAAELGARFVYGAQVEGLDDDGEDVTVHLADGTTSRYALVVGADGLHSTVRSLIGITEEPRRTGMGIWRAFVPRPAEVTRTDLVYGGPVYIAGYCPTTDDTCYAYLVEDVQDRTGADGPAIMRELAAGYGGPWKEIRESIDDGANVNYTSFTTHFVEGDWHRGRVVIIGDAAHSCPPTIAQGAAQSFEDAAVLAELLLGTETLDDALFAEFLERRRARAKRVVEASTQLGQWLLDHDRSGDPGALIGEIGALVSEPA